MADRAAVLEAAIATNKRYLANTGGLGYAEKIKRYEAELAAIEAAKVAQKVADSATEWSGTFDQALERFLDAEDIELEKLGRPHGRNGELRGAMSRNEHIELARSIGVLDELGGEDFFGPLVPGAEQ